MFLLSKHQNQKKSALKKNVPPINFYTTLKLLAPLIFAQTNRKMTFGQLQPFGSMLGYTYGECFHAYMVYPVYRMPSRQRKHIFDHGKVRKIIDPKVPFTAGDILVPWRVTLVGSI